MFSAATKSKQVSSAANYIEDMFQTWLYTGNGSTQTITNGIDLSGKGGLVWIKDRSQTGPYNALFDTVRGATKELVSNTTDAQFTSANTLTSFSSSGFSIGSDSDVNINGNKLVSWTFRKQPKFFDVVTWTGDGTSNRQVSHNLGAAPGCVIMKRLDDANDWLVYHRSLGENKYIKLNLTDAADTLTDVFNSMNASTFRAYYNVNGATYVAYLFAHDAGGFGLTGTDNVISCGSFTQVSGGTAVNLGYEPQWLLFKKSSGADSWRLFDTMRSYSMTANDFLFPNTSGAEIASVDWGYPTATGFNSGPSPDVGSTYIYIAIRRGPMKTPTSGTSVFSPNTTSNDGNPITTNFPVDMFFDNNRAGNSANTVTMDRLRGSMYLSTAATAAEADMGAYGPRFGSNTTVTPYAYLSGSEVVYSFRRAPGFFDVVCYTGTGAAQNISHNLTVVPELVIFKSRSSSAYSWYVGTQFTSTDYLYARLNGTDAGTTYGYGSIIFGSKPTSTQIALTSSAGVNNSGDTFVAYLFASCPGVSKVGSYTGNGSTQTINCGFTGGARFVLIKRTDSTGDWYVYDTARGMTTLTDPYLLLNSTAAESATLGSVTTVTTGFAVNASILAAINTNGASYIFLAIA